MDKNETYDVIIIGGGIAGSVTGRLIAEQDFRVLVVEEHREIGRPVQCAGLVTPRIFDHVPENGCVLNEVSGAKIYSPSGQELVIDAKKTKAVVIDRVKLDSGAMSTALRAGCDLALGVRAIYAKYNNNRVMVQVEQDGKRFNISCKILIGADGVQSRVASWFGLKGPKLILSGFGAEAIGTNINPRLVEIYLGNNVAPNFFAWVIPTSKKRTNSYFPARVGLICSNEKNNAYYYYKQLFNHQLLGPKLQNIQPVQYIAGGVPLGTVPKSYTNNIMLVGDAAGQVKPSSGGGIYTSIVCAEFCAETAASALEVKNYSAKFLKSYQKAWLGELGKELKHGMRLHKVYMHLTDDQLEEGFKLLRDPKILEIISKKGDIDYPSKVTRLLFKKVPQLLRFAKPYLKSFF